MAWREKIIGDLTGLRVIAYVDYLNKFLAIKLPIDVNTNQLYYFKNNSDYIFPKEFNGKYILCRLYRVFPSDLSDMGNPWIPMTGGEPTQYTCNYWFYVIDKYDTITDMQNSKGEFEKVRYLHGFNDVVNDNKYFSKIPEINELEHWDNGIISNSKVTANYELNENPDEWYNFTVTHTTVTDKTFSIIKMLDDNHENPER